MKLKDQEYWDNQRRINTDPYGKCCLDFAEAWANLMEREIESGKKLAEIANAASHEADEPYGITGFMYGCAVKILARAWEHGEELRVWRNLDTQIGNEGEKANASGGVLNPALLTIETKE